MTAALDGFLLGGGLIIAIGAQNAFILRQGLLRSHVFVLCLVCAVSDAALIALGVAGMGALVTADESLLTIVRVGGTAFLFGYAALAARRAWRPDAMEVRGERLGLPAALVTVLTFTFLNPHVYLDTVVLVGGISATYPNGERPFFAGGAIAASFAWFFTLGYGARWLAPLFKKPAAWRALDAAIAVVMVWLGAMLLMN